MWLHPLSRFFCPAQEADNTMLPSIRRNRALLPRFLLGPRVLAWQCSVCRKMFALSVEELERLAAGSVPAYIQGAFEAHDCVIELEILAERTQQSLHNPR